MISGGNTTVYVSNLDAAIRFYTESLGLKLTNRFGDRWATIEAGPSYWSETGAGLVIGLHPPSPRYPSPGTKGAVGFGLETYEPIDEILARLAKRGVRATSEIIRFEGGASVALEDQDGNPTYLFQPSMPVTPDTDLAPESTSAPQPPPTMVSGGHAIVYVSNLDAAIRFYTETLGLKLAFRFEDKIAGVEAGRLVVALHPKTQYAPDPGTKGAMVLGLQVDEPIERVMAVLAQRGVRLTGGTTRSEKGAIISIEDPDGNPIEITESGTSSVPQDDLASAAPATP
jgi:catechol 2,3-dioxygenase-like lactoylglutathione lyase family enzyme